MFNDISCDKECNEEECVANSRVVTVFAKKLGIAHWSFIGPGSENKWSSMEENSLQGIWDHLAEQMLVEFAESGCPIFRVSGSFIFRHHVEPRVKLYSSKEESVPFSNEINTLT